MSYFRRGYNWEVVRYVPAPTGGWNPDTPWHELPDNQAPVLDNFLVKNGKIVTRGGFSVVQDLSALNPLNARGWVSGANKPTVLTTGGYGTAVVGNDTSQGGTAPWSNTAILAVSQGPAFVSAGASVITDQLDITAFGFAIPAGATIIGIQVNVDRSSSSVAFDNAIALIQGGTIVGARTMPGVWPTSPTTVIYGGPTDLWGQAWTPAEINASNFGASISANVPGGSTAYVHAVQITVYYRPVGGSTVANATWFLLGRKVVAQTIDHWDVPLLRPTTSASLGVGNGAPVFVTPSSNAPVTAASTPTIGPRWINFDGLLYGISYDDLGTGGTASDVNSTYITWKTKLLTLPLNEVTGTLPTVLTNAPQGAYDLKGHQSRIWLLGGVDVPGGGTTHSSTTIFFTNPIASGGGTATADWKDPVSGLTNQIVLDKNTADFGVALASIREGLLILRRNSIWIIRGTTTANYTASRVSSETGCIDARSVLETDQGVYFLSAKGLMLTNGVTVRNVSGPVTETLQYAVSAEQAQVLAQNGGYATCALTVNGNIMVSIGTYARINNPQVKIASYPGATGVPSGSAAAIWTGFYDRGVGAWSRITSQLWASDISQATGMLYPGPVFISVLYGLTLAIGNKYLTTMPGLDRQSGSALYDQLPSGDSPYLSIPAVWKSRPGVDIGMTSRKFGQPKRFFLDYVMAAPDILAASGWSAQPVKADDSNNGNSLAATIATGLSASSVAGFVVPTSRVQRQNQDFANEIDDLAFDVTWSDVDRAVQPNAVVAEVYGIGVEYQPTRDAR